jgi:hypothetical protein
MSGSVNVFIIIGIDPRTTQPDLIAQLQHLLSLML